MADRWLVTVDNLHDGDFDDFLKELKDENLLGSPKVREMGPKTTAVFQTDLWSDQKIMKFVKDRLDHEIGRATIAKLIGDTNVGTVWNIDMEDTGRWTAFRPIAE